MKNLIFYLVFRISMTFFTIQTLVVHFHRPVAHPHA